MVTTDGGGDAPRWSMDDLVALVDGMRIVGRDERARPMPLPAPLLEVADADERSWTDQLSQDHPSGYAEVVESWWQALSDPGVVQAACVDRETPEGWQRFEIGTIDLRHQDDVGCVLTFVRPLGPADPPVSATDPGTAAFDSPHSIIQQLDELGTVIGTTGDIERVFGCQEADLVGRSVVECLHPDDRDAAVAMWLEVLGAPENARTIEQRVLRTDGTALWIQSTVVNKLDTTGTVLAMSHDVSEQRAQRAALEASEQQLRFLAEAVPVGVFRTDADRRITFTNGRAADLLGDAATFDDLLVRVDPEDRTRLDCLFGSACVGGEIVVGRVRGVETGRHLEFRLQGVVDPSESEVRPDVIGTIDDVTAAVARTVELQANAERDPLTGLANRAGVHRVLEAALVGGRRPLVVFGDLDDFKRVNDRWGHAAGDAVLTQIGQRLRTAVRPDDLVGRWGGDEFVVVCHDVESTAEDEVVDRLHDALAVPVRGGDGRPYVASVSVGAVRPLPGETTQSVLRRADAAMYGAKRARARVGERSNGRVGLAGADVDR